MTAPAVRPPAWDTLELALHQQRPVELTYRGRRRTVSPHALGWKGGRAMLLAYQCADQTTTRAHLADPRRRWRNFFVDEIDDAVPADRASTWQTADNYDASHPFSTIDHLSIAAPSGHPRAPVR
jgi:predicted DNA-binding transcriptional regulator YafY